MTWQVMNTGEIATDIQLRDVLVDIQELLIRGEYKHNLGDEETWLKDVSFGAKKTASDSCKK